MSAAPHDAPHDALSRSLSCIADARREFLAPIGDKPRPMSRRSVS
jgi:hypothetical protein